MREFLRVLSQSVVEAVGTVWAALIAVCIVGGWLWYGWMHGYSQFWFLLLNSSCTVVTFLMVFFIQHAQNRESKAVQLKLNELIRAVEGARSGMMGIESAPDAHLKELQEEFLGDKVDEAET